jgi:hypothetical protein
MLKLRTVRQQGRHTIRAEVPRTLGFVPGGWDRQQRVQMKAGSRLPLGQQRPEVVEVAEELALGASLLEEIEESMSVRMIGGWLGDEYGILEL